MSGATSLGAPAFMTTYLLFLVGCVAQKVSKDLIYTVHVTLTRFISSLVESFEHTQILKCQSHGLLSETSTFNTCFLLDKTSRKMLD